MVGFTPGTAAKARRPTTASAAMAATSATVRAGGRRFSYQPKATARIAPSAA